MIRKKGREEEKKKKNEMAWRLNFIPMGHVVMGCDNFVWVATRRGCEHTTYKGGNDISLLYVGAGAVDEGRQQKQTEKGLALSVKRKGQPTIRVISGVEPGLESCTPKKKGCIGVAI